MRARTLSAPTRAMSNPKRESGAKRSVAVRASKVRHTRDRAARDDVERRTRDVGESNARATDERLAK